MILSQSPIFGGTHHFLSLVIFFMLWYLPSFPLISIGYYPFDFRVTVLMAIWYSSLPFEHVSLSISRVQHNIPLSLFLALSLYNSIFLCLYVSISSYLSLYVFMSLCLYVSTSLSFYFFKSLCLYVTMPLCLYFFKSLCLCLYFNLSFYQSICM